MTVDLQEPAVARRDKVWFTRHGYNNWMIGRVISTDPLVVKEGRLMWTRLPAYEPAGLVPR